MNKGLKVLVTGGAGYVGSALVPQLLEKGYDVNVLDLYLFGDDVLDAVRDHPHLTQIKGDLRDRATVDRAVAGCDAVIHLACISNDPSFELDPGPGQKHQLRLLPRLGRQRREKPASSDLFTPLPPAFTASKKRRM